jgi:hypothetical protein
MMDGLKHLESQGSWNVRSRSLGRGIAVDRDRGTKDWQFLEPRRGAYVGATHIESSTSQSQSRNHPLLSNGSVKTLLRRCDSWINSPLLGKTCNNT